MHPKTLNLAIIGAGRMGSIHARNIATRIPGARLAAVADINLAAARKVAAKFGVPCATADYRDLLQDVSIRAVIVCCATDAHAPIIEEAAAARKHIFCEKPIGHDLLGIWRALEAVEKAGVKLQVGFNRRFDPSFARLKEAVAAGKIGTPHIVRITSRDPSPPSIEYVCASGGLLLDMTIHDFDMVRFLTGQEVEEVYATGGALIDPEIGQVGDIDTCLTTLRLRGGAFATIDNSRRAVYGYDQRVEVFGSAGMVVGGNACHEPERPLTPSLSPSDGERVPMAGERAVQKFNMRTFSEKSLHDSHVLSSMDDVHCAKPFDFFLERYQESFLMEMQDFITCVRHNRRSSVTGLDGLKPVVTALAAIKSLRENRPVRLSEPSDHFRCDRDYRLAAI